MLLLLVGVRREGDEIWLETNLTKWSKLGQLILASFHHPDYDISNRYRHLAQYSQHVSVLQLCSSSSFIDLFLAQLSWNSTLLFQLILNSTLTLKEVRTSDHRLPNHRPLLQQAVGCSGGELERCGAAIRCVRLGLDIGRYDALFFRSRLLP